MIGVAEFKVEYPSAPAQACQTEHIHAMDPRRVTCRSSFAKESLHPAEDPIKITDHAIWTFMVREPYPETAAHALITYVDFQAWGDE